MQNIGRTMNPTMATNTIMKKLLITVPMIEQTSQTCRFH